MDIRNNPTSRPFPFVPFSHPPFQPVSIPPLESRLSARSRAREIPSRDGKTRVAPPRFQLEARCTYTRTRRTRLCRAANVHEGGGRGGRGNATSHSTTTRVNKQCLSSNDAARMTDIRGSEAARKRKRAARLNKENEKHLERRERRGREGEKDKRIERRGKERSNKRQRSEEKRREEKERTDGAAGRQRPGRSPEGRSHEYQSFH